MIKVKIPICMLQTLRGPFSSILLYDKPFLAYVPVFGKVHQMTLTCWRSKTWMLHTPPIEAHIFISSLYDKPFLGYSSMFAKMHRMAPNDFDMFKVKNTNMHATYTPKAQLFVCFPLRWAIFELRPFSWKCTKWPRLVQGRKYQHACYIHPRGPNFQPFRSTMSRFWVTAQFSGTALNDPKWPS